MAQGPDGNVGELTCLTQAYSCSAEGNILFQPLQASVGLALKGNGGRSQSWFFRSFDFGLMYSWRLFES